MNTLTPYIMLGDNKTAYKLTIDSISWSIRKMNDQYIAVRLAGMYSGIIDSQKPTIHETVRDIIQWQCELIKKINTN